MTSADSLYRLARPLLFRLEPERAHRLAILALRLGVYRDRTVDPPILRQRLWGRDFANPLGLAAGFDKNGEVFRQALGLGFGFVELGSVTPRPQSGNPRPRLFRSAAAEAIINRMGFNNDGLERIAARLARRQAAHGIVGANLGKNGDSADAAADYERGIAALGPLCDYLVVNVSSPNTPGLRDLQGAAVLPRLLERLLRARERNCGDSPPPLLLKIAPDLTPEERRAVADIALESGIDGLIVANTTTARPDGLDPAFAREGGGLSGKPLFAPSTALLRDMYRLTQGRLPLIGVGGVGGGAEAYAKIRAGASLLQLYSALVFQGPGLVRRVKRDLAAELARDGFAAIADAVGADHRGGA